MDAENTLILTLDTGTVTIKLRPDLAPGLLPMIEDAWQTCLRPSKSRNNRRKGEKVSG